ncbi:CPBP family intramembrane glutamic endopeptidase [Paeniglutamicibacter cryotolerans]|uniref:CAAX prenyl protease 2/Lysostaphin resistance protein A-like domain-containing protein n=1 Tax=Paeniglutamicibacter cryotolerans TaxID=670079 RepID=A0A839QJE6_9MICC|nr:type II CAAX endopeptidase family protein [Paeniglutamicibacter cryotolerans]MBB2994854.1 hypothetical protein [Paeniglutamicibacter cryotolerans]
MAYQIAPASLGQTPRRRHPVFGPGRFRVGDAVMVALYLLLMVAGGASLIMALPGFAGAFRNEEAALFAVNLIAYMVLFTGAMIMAFKTLKNSARTFRYNPWAKWFLVPGTWFGSLMVTAILLTLMGQAVKSENQLAIEGMTREIPFTTMFFVAVVMGPLVEEYIFRHLLIGKLSRKLNVWVCVVISIILFAGIHFVGSGSFEITSAIPYVTLGAVISVAYVLSGRSMAYSYVLHFFNNAVALSVSYTLLPLLQS